MGAGSRHSLSRERTTDWWSRPRWPDGRIISSLDDGIPHWIRFLAIAPLFVWVWVLGRFGFPVAATVPDAPLVLVSLLLAAACCWLESNRRLWALVDASSPAMEGGAPRLTAASDTRRLWPSARWPDGRYVGGGGRMAETLKWLGLLLTIAATWVLGSFDVAAIDVVDRWARLDWVLTVPMGILGIVSNSRVRALAASAAAEGPAWRPTARMTQRSVP